MEKASLVVLISGSGSNLQAIIDAISQQKLDAQIKAVICNRESAKGLDRARHNNIETHIIDHKQFSDRKTFDQAMINVIDPINPELVVLAGFMRILSDEFIDHYAHRLMNIHPSLLPKYKGLNTHLQAIENGDDIHGATVHYVGHELDSGPTVIQAEVRVLATDTVTTLAERVLIEEHKIYPLAIQLHIENRLKFKNNKLEFDNKPLPHPLFWKNDSLITEQT